MSSHKAPTLEIRVPISPNDQDLRMLRYLLESLQEFGGPIGRSAHCVASVGEDVEPRDLKQDHNWTADHSIDFRWVDRELFRQDSYNATGNDRFWVESKADVVAFLDADLLIGGNFDPAVTEVHRRQSVRGFVGHVSPFGFPGLSHIPSADWWNRVFEEAGLPEPALEWQHTGYGLDWQSFRRESAVVSKDARHSRCPAYFNAGVIIGPRLLFEPFRRTFESDLDAVSRVMDGLFTWQIAHCVSLARHEITCEPLPVNYNFALNVPEAGIRALNPDPFGEDNPEDIRIFHYIGGREHFSTPETVRSLLIQPDLSGAWREFQRKLEIVAQRIGDDI